MTILPDLSANPQRSPTTTGKSVAARASANDKASAAKTGRIKSLFIFITCQEFVFWTRRGHGEFVAGPAVHAASIFRDQWESTGESRSESRSLDQVESSVKLEVLRWPAAWH